MIHNGTLLDQEGPWRDAADYQSEHWKQVPRTHVVEITREEAHVLAAHHRQLGRHDKAREYERLLRTP